MTMFVSSKTDTLTSVPFFTDLSLPSNWVFRKFILQCSGGIFPNFAKTLSFCGPYRSFAKRMQIIPTQYDRLLLKFSHTCSNLLDRHMAKC